MARLVTLFAGVLSAILSPGAERTRKRRPRVPAARGSASRPTGNRVRLGVGSFRLEERIEPAQLAVVSAIASADDGNVAAKTIDGDLNTRWSAEGDGQWIQFELAATAAVEQVQIAFFRGNERIQAFDLQVATDGGFWTTVFSGASSGTTTGLQSFGLGGAAAHYVRIVGHENNLNAWNSLTEVSIVGQLTSSPAYPPVLLAEPFAYPDVLITDEFAYFNPTSPAAVQSPIWDVTSGALSATQRMGATNSGVFRMTTKRRDFLNVAVTFDLNNQRLATPGENWDGVHIFLRHQDETKLYYASINRRDNQVVIKKKVTGGPNPSNGGTYYPLTPSDLRHEVPYDRWQQVMATVRNNADGSVTIQLFSGNQLLASATDHGVGGPPITSPGQVGIRGDNADFKFDNFTVISLDPPPLPPPPPPPVPDEPSEPPPPPGQPPGAAAPFLAGGPADGTVRLVSANEGAFALGNSFPALPGLGVSARTAVAGVTGDGVPDFVVGAGPGSAPHVLVLDGAAGAVVVSFSAFEDTFGGVVFVAAAGIDGDGHAEIVVTPDESGGPVVAVYRGSQLAAGVGGQNAQLTRFFGIAGDPNFRGGCRPALGGVNGDGSADLVVSAGVLGGPRIAVFDGRSLAGGSGDPGRLVGDFFAFEDSLRNGAFVAVGGVTGDDRAEIAFGGGPGGAPRVRLFDGAKLLASPPAGSVDGIAAAQLANFFAGDPSLRGGVRLALHDADADGRADLAAGSGSDEPSRVRVYKSATVLAGAAAADVDLDPFGAVLPNGVFVG